MTSMKRLEKMPKYNINRNYFQVMQSCYGVLVTICSEGIIYSSIDKVNCYLNDDKRRNFHITIFHIIMIMILKIVASL